MATGVAQSSDESSCVLLLDRLACRDYEREPLARTRDVPGILRWHSPGKRSSTSKKEQVRVLKEQQEKDRRILPSDQQRIRLATKAQQLTRELLETTTVLFTPETVLG